MKPEKLPYLKSERSASSRVDREGEKGGVGRDPGEYTLVDQREDHTSRRRGFTNCVVLLIEGGR